MTRNSKPYHHLPCAEFWTVTVTFFRSKNSGNIRRNYIRLFQRTKPHMVYITLFLKNLSQEGWKSTDETGEKVHGTISVF